MTYDDPNNAPKAHTTQSYKCNRCEHLHVMLMDEQGKYIATAVISRAMLVNMLKVIDDDPEIMVQ